MSTIANFSLDQYERMVEAGIFDGLRRQRVELIRGEIRAMTPIGTRHAQAVDDLTEWSLQNADLERVKVRIQATVRIPALESSPEPDVMWLVRKNYATKHPEPNEVLLLIEVAESSLEEDRSEKAELYAEVGIQDYWIINLVDHCTEVHRKPSRTKFAELRKYGSDETIRPLAFPEVEFHYSRVVTA